jgi:hypothetical protein
MKQLLATLTILAAVSVTVRAQLTFRIILGTVHDQSVAVIPGITVVVTNLDSNATRTVMSMRRESIQYSTFLSGGIRQ